MSSLLSAHTHTHTHIVKSVETIRSSRITGSVQHICNRLHVFFCLFTRFLSGQTQSRLSCFSHLEALISQMMLLICPRWTEGKRESGGGRSETERGINRPTAVGFNLWEAGAALTDPSVMLCVHMQSSHLLVHMSGLQLLFFWLLWCSQASVGGRFAQLFRPIRIQQHLNQNPVTAADLLPVRLNPAQVRKLVHLHILNKSQQLLWFQPVHSDAVTHLFNVRRAGFNQT